MQSRSIERNHHSFIIRVWFESACPGEGQWRGSIVHLNTGQRMYFHSPIDLLDFITLCLPDIASWGKESHDPSKGEAHE